MMVVGGRRQGGRWHPEMRGLGQAVAAYANAMSDLFAWLFQKRQVVNNDASVQDRFRIDIL